LVEPAPTAVDETSQPTEATAWQMLGGAATTVATAHTTLLADVQ
jgi:hypothetical protein